MRLRRGCVYRVTWATVLELLNRDDVDFLYQWLLLNYACGSPVSIKTEMLEACVERNRPHCLQLLLGSYLVILGDNAMKLSERLSDDMNLEGDTVPWPTEVTEDQLRSLEIRAANLICSDDASHRCHRLLVDDLRRLEYLKSVAPNVA